MQEAQDGYSTLDALAFDYLRTLPPYRPAPFPGPDYPGAARPATPGAAPGAPPPPDPSLIGGRG
jgi:hypothetical protein